jgi:DNA-binding MurR/RpiR family transcriptional regulator
LGQRPEPHNICPRHHSAAASNTNVTNRALTPGRPSWMTNERPFQPMVRELIEAQRRAIVGLRNSGEISNDVMHRLERELDLEDQRLET